jgi:hypothetical protein
MAATSTACRPVTGKLDQRDDHRGLRPLTSDLASPMRGSCITEKKVDGAYKYSTILRQQEIGVAVAMTPPGPLLTWANH